MLTLLVGFGATLASAPLVRRLMINMGVLDTPNHRSSHTLITPRGGGLACLFGVVVAVLGCLALTGTRPPWTAVLAAVGLCAVGFLDDRFNLAAAPRLLAQVSAGGAVGVAVGGIWWAVAGAVVVPFVVNVVNFMDGINGITGLHVGWWGAVALLVGLRNETPALAFLGALCAGCSLGFLPVNFPRARMFLGDSGSYLLGGLLAAGVMYAGAGSADWALVAAPLTLYAVDTVWTLLSRLRSHAPMMTAHRDHTYQYVSGILGYSHVAVALGMVAVSITITLVWAASPAAGIFVALTASILYLNASRILPAANLRTGS